VLAQALDAEHPADGPGVRAWALGTLAEIHARLGDVAMAEDRFRAALALEPDDVYLLAALADLLLEDGRPAEARRLAERDLRADTLLLRAALAARDLAAPDADTLLSALLDRFADAARRGDTTHLREAARAQLALAGDPARALDIAVRNWAIQREPADARLLLQAALAARRSEAAQPVLTWVEETRIEDLVLRDLVARIRAR
jgi:predicted Zn-dependent protease